MTLTPVVVVWFLGAADSCGTTAASL